MTLYNILRQSVTNEQIHVCYQRNDLFNTESNFKMHPLVLKLLIIKMNQLFRKIAFYWSGQLLFKKNKTNA